MKDITIENKKARHDYFVEETLECGVALKGNEVKSIRYGMCNIKESWVAIQNGNLVMRGCHISKWDTANLFDIDENRERQLLAHKKEIRKLQDFIKDNGCTLIPLKLYFVKGRVKVLVGLCRGKHIYDKRESLKKKDAQRQIDRALKEKQRC